MPRRKCTGLPCVSCDSTRTRVVDTRPIDDGVRRTRYCPKCRRKFSTHELPAPASDDGAVHARIASAARRLDALPRHDREALLRILTAFETAQAVFPDRADSIGQPQVTQ